MHIGVCSDTSTHAVCLPPRKGQFEADEPDTEAAAGPPLSAAMTGVISALNSSKSSTLQNVNLTRIGYAPDVNTNRVFSHRPFVLSASVTFLTTSSIAYKHALTSESPLKRRPVAGYCAYLSVYIKQVCAHRVYVVVVVVLVVETGRGRTLTGILPRSSHCNWRTQ